MRVDHVLDIFTFYKAFRSTSQIDEHVYIEESDTPKEYWKHLLNWKFDLADQGLSAGTQELIGTALEFRVDFLWKLGHLKWLSLIIIEWTSNLLLLP